MCQSAAPDKVLLRFSKSENTEDELKALREYLEENGIPHSIYTDTFGVYCRVVKI